MIPSTPSKPTTPAGKTLARADRHCRPRLARHTPELHSSSNCGREGLVTAVRSANAAPSSLMSGLPFPWSARRARGVSAHPQLRRLSGLHPSFRDMACPMRFVDSRRVMALIVFRTVGRPCLPVTMRREGLIPLRGLNPCQPTCQGHAEVPDGQRGLATHPQNRSLTGRPDASRNSIAARRQKTRGGCS